MKKTATGSYAQEVVEINQALLGNTYLAGVVFLLAESGVVDVVFTPPAGKELSLIYSVHAERSCLFTKYEAPVFDEGYPLDSFNRLRSSEEVSEVVILLEPTVKDPGLQLFTTHIGGGYKDGAVGGDFCEDVGFVPKPEVPYLFRIENKFPASGVNSYVSIKFDWVEDVDA
jgi:hypothetical protein